VVEMLKQENLVEKFVETLRKGGTLYLCEKCGLLTSYVVRREITEFEERDAFTDETKYIRDGDVDEEFVCPNCYREVQQLDWIEGAIEELEFFVEQNPQNKLEKQVLEKLREQESL